MAAAKYSHPKMTDIGLLFLRVSVGGLMLLGHGWGKLIHYSEYAAKFADPIGLGPSLSLSATIFAEVLCAIFVVLGIGTRFAIIPLVFTMLVAAFIVHSDDPFHKKEFAILFAIPFLTLGFTGGGRYTLGRYFPLLGRWS